LKIALNKKFLTFVVKNIFKMTTNIRNTQKFPLFAAVLQVKFRIAFSTTISDRTGEQLRESN
jgi:hypothetical protein